jgi:hypothetical protein
MDRSDVQHARENGKPNAKVGDELWWVARSIGPVSVSNNHWAGDYLDLSPEDICLISAAPDLLEALKSINYSISQAVLSGNDWRRELLLIGSIVNDAISKAEKGNHE